MRRPYHVVDRLNLLMPSASVIKLLSNPRIPINALAYGLGINRNSRVANQLNNLASGINYYLIIVCEQTPLQLWLTGMTTKNDSEDSDTEAKETISKFSPQMLDLCCAWS